MLRLLIKKRGQSTLEYAILVVVVIMALVAIQAYLKRGIQGRMKDSADQIGDQFSPIYTQYNHITESGSYTTENQTAWETKTTYDERDDGSKSYSHRRGWENITALDKESETWE